MLVRQREETQRIKSNVEKQLRRSGLSQMALADDKRERGYVDHLANYYERVMSCIRNADSILIFGPGEAKGELKKLLDKNHLGKRIVGVDTEDKMTDRQIARKVRKRFLPPNEEAERSGR